MQQATYDPTLGRISVRKYLAILQRYPEQIPAYIINQAQARLYLKYSTLINPEKVKIITYKTPNLRPDIATAAERAYKQQLSQIVEEIIKDWLFKERKRGEPKTKLEMLFEFLRPIQKQVFEATEIEKAKRPTKELEESSKSKKPKTDN